MSLFTPFKLLPHQIYSGAPFNFSQFNCFPHLAFSLWLQDSSITFIFPSASCSNPLLLKDTLNGRFTVFGFCSDDIHETESNL